MRPPNTPKRGIKMIPMILSIRSTGSFLHDRVIPRFQEMNGIDFGPYFFFPLRMRRHFKSLYTISCIRCIFIISFFIQIYFFHFCKRIR
jgi:hypothetical protein